MSTLALIGLGSNVGDRRAILDGAIAALTATPGITLESVSSYHETAPVGGPPGQGPFLNAAARIDASPSPPQLLARFQEIEHEHGRERRVRWGERSLDLDLLLFGDHVIGRHSAFSLGWRNLQQPIQIPHPHLPFRRFVLAPAAEVAADFRDPITRRTIGELLANLDRRPSYLALPYGPTSSSQTHRRRFREITSTLKAAGWSRGNGPWFAPPSRDYPYGVPFKDLPEEVRAQRTRAKGDAIRSRGEELRTDRWTEELWGDRWIVTDDWFDLFLGPFEMGVATDEFWEVHRTVTEPTLVVLPRPFYKDISVAIRAGWFEDDGGWPIGGSGPPIYVPEALDVDGFAAEVCTLCLATRP